MKVVKVILTPHDSIIIVSDASARLGPSCPWYHGQVSPDPWRLYLFSSFVQACARCLSQQEVNGDIKEYLLVRLPRNCQNKQVWTAFNAYDSYFPHVREAGAIGYVLNWCGWDHAIADFIGDTVSCRSAAYYKNLDDVVVYLLWLKDWTETRHCPWHDAQLMFKYGLMSVLGTTEDDLRNVWGTCEAFRGGFSELMDRLHILVALISLVKKTTDKKEV